MSNSVNDDNFSNQEDLDLESCEPPLLNYAEVIPAELFAQSVIISRMIINNTISKAYKQVEEKYIQQMIPNEANLQTLQVIHTIMNISNLVSVKELTIIQEDTEPSLVNYDRWRRNRVNYGEQHNIEENIIQEQSISKPSSTRKKRGVQSLQNIPQTEAKLIEFQVDEEEDEFIEKLRTKKIYDQKKKNEQKIKNDEMAQQKQKKESYYGKYTYDFDGKILMSKDVKIDKLSNVNQKIKVEFKGGGGTKSTTEIKKVLVADIPNKNILERKEPTKEVTGDKGLRIDRGAQLPYDTFLMNRGVKLIYEQRTKEGYRSSINDSTEQLQYKLSGQYQIIGEDQQKLSQIRITKSEYKLLTDNGLFHQTHKSNKSGISKKIEEVMEEDSTVKNQIVKFITNQSNQSKNPQPKKPVILMRNAKLLDNMLTPVTEINNKTNRMDKIDKTTDILKSTPVDIFNQSLLNSKDWGKSGIRNSYLPKVPSYQNRTHNSSLEQLYKLPRDRVNYSTNGFFGSRERRNSEIQTFYSTHTKFDERLRQF